MPEKQTVPVYRIENPTKEGSGGPDGITSHKDLIGQWFSPNIETALNYLHKSTQRFGKNAGPIDGTQLVVAYVPADELDAHHVMRHPVASGMDVENDNYIIPRDGTIATEIIPLDETLGDLRGHIGNFNKRVEAKQRVHALLGHMAVEK